MPRAKSNKRMATSTRRKTKTIKRTPSITRDKKSNIVRVFLEILNIVKLYHWKTRSFAQHKTTDELYEHLNEHIDKFVEVLLGKDESRIYMVNHRIRLIDPESKSTFKARIYEFRAFLVDMNMYFDSKRDTDILNIRDEILGDINQFLYLLTFDK